MQAGFGQEGEKYGGTRNNRIGREEERREEGDGGDDDDDADEGEKEARSRGEEESGGVGGEPNIEKPGKGAEAEEGGAT